MLAARYKIVLSMHRWELSSRYPFVFRLPHKVHLHESGLSEQSAWPADVEQLHVKMLLPAEAVEEVLPVSTGVCFRQSLSSLSWRGLLTHDLLHICPLFGVSTCLHKCFRKHKSAISLAPNNTNTCGRVCLYAASAADLLLGRQQDREKGKW